MKFAVKSHKPEAYVPDMRCVRLVGMVGVGGFVDEVEELVELGGDYYFGAAVEGAAVGSEVVGLSLIHISEPTRL